MQCTLSIKENTFILQRNFRAIMNAFSMPSNVYKIDLVEIYGTDDLKANLCVSVLDIFVEHQTSYCISVCSGNNSSVSNEVIQSISSTLNGQQTNDEKIADYVVYWNGTSNESILKLKRGSLEYPDESATAIYIVDEILNGNEPISDLQNLMTFRAEGPGIALNKGTFSIMNFSKRELEMIKEVNSKFPLGIDVLFVDIMGNIVGLPRSSRLL